MSRKLPHLWDNIISLEATDLWEGRNGGNSTLNSLPDSDLNFDYRQINVSADGETQNDYRPNSKYNAQFNYLNRVLDSIVNVFAPSFVDQFKSAEQNDVTFVCIPKGKTLPTIDDTGVLPALRSDCSLVQLAYRSSTFQNGKRHSNVYIDCALYSKLGIGVPDYRGVYSENSPFQSHEEENRIYNRNAILAHEVIYAMGSRLLHLLPSHA